MRHLFARFWWIFVMRGVLGILLSVLCVIWLVQISQPIFDHFGLLVFLKRAVVIEMIIVLLACYAFMDGIFAVLLGIQNYGQGHHWWSLVVEGSISVALGLGVYFFPTLSIWVLFDWVVFWAVFSGLLEIIQAFDLREYADRRTPYFLAGLASLSFGLMLTLYAQSAGEALIWILGSYALLFGSLLLRLGIQFRHYWVEWQKRTQLSVPLTKGGKP